MSAVFCYDANGNMTQKIDGSSTNYTYDAENRMTAVSGAATATFVYDGDGNRVKGVVGGVTTTYIGNYFEPLQGRWTGSTSTMKKYYYAGGSRVAERKGTTLYWLLSDHQPLQGAPRGSTSITATSSGSKTAELRYKAWGETRYTYGTTQTTIRYTGQREESSLGLYWYASRWYSPGLGRFVSPDSIIPQPGSPLAWDRYGYTYSNPVRYTDSTGHCIDGATTILCIAMAAGAIAGYAIQVGENRSQGRSWGEALTTNISAEKILGGAVIAGSVIVGAAVLSAGLTAVGITIGAACLKQDCTTEAKNTIGALDTIRKMTGNEKGTAYENWLKATTGGEGSFTLEGTQFDNKVGNILMEAKSFNWNNFNLADFQNQVGRATAIATRNGYQYVMHLLNKPPQSVLDWLIKKGIDYIIESGAK